jgi:hypothetical protein
MNNNYNNLYGDYIGATGVYSISDYIDITSNILAINSSNFTLGTSNILEINSSNYTNTNIINLDNKYNELINQKTEIETYSGINYNVKHTYINNSNLDNPFSEIRFYSKNAINYPTYEITASPIYKVKIGNDGKLYIWYSYNPFISLTLISQWIDLNQEIGKQQADGLNQGSAIVALENQVILINSTLTAISGELTSLYALSSGSSGTGGLSGSAYNVPRLDNGIITTAEIDSIRNNLITRTQTVQNYITNLGGATGVLAVIYGIAEGFGRSRYVNTMIDQLTSNLNSNIAIGNTQNAQIISNTRSYTSNNYLISNLKDVYDNYSNLSLLQGFINCNIQTIQNIPYISSSNLYASNISSSNLSSLNLYTSNLYVNSGYINGIDINNLKTSGDIIESGTSLSSKYLTSNHLYNLSYNYTVERQYPSKLYTTATPEGTTTLLNKLVYNQTLFLDNQAISYGSGFYEIYSSSTFDTSTTKDRLFNFNTSETTSSPRWAISLYNSGTGNYQGDNSIDGVYFGDWVIIKLPKEILLTRYRIYQRSDFLTKAPAEWKFYGSKDGINFVEITEATQATRLSTYSGGYFEKSLNQSFNIMYQYFGIVINKILSTSGQSDLSFSELQLFGKEILNNSITSQIYATSNAVKGIVEFEMPIVAKHYGFYITITTPININGTTYYKYDIDLRKYTKLGVIQIGPQSGDTFRSFKIRVMYGTMYFSYIINDLPNVCYYEVFMSYKNTASPPNGAAGLNACAIGYPPNTTLQTIMPNNLFIIKNGAGDINYITVVSTNAADCRVIIEDLIG